MYLWEFAGEQFKAEVAAYLMLAWFGFTRVDTLSEISDIICKTIYKNPKGRNNSGKCLSKFLPL
jgi:hypothetical protein